MMLSITPDQLCAAGGYIARTWGDYGYRIEAIESPTPRVALGVDRWGNPGPRSVDSHGYESAERTADLAALVTEMHAKAAA